MFSRPTVELTGRRSTAKSIQVLRMRSPLTPLRFNDCYPAPDCNALPVFYNQGTGERGVVVAVEVCLGASRAARASDKSRAGLFWLSKSEAG
jgi:hypothetical protein